MSLEVDDDNNPGPLMIRDLDSGISATPETPRVVWLHGFSQTSACLGDVPTLLNKISGGSLIHSVAVDLPGHGTSQNVPALDLRKVADIVALTTGPAAYVGYSMGGRLALHLALAHPQSVKRLVLIGATAGIDNVEERSTRRSSDEALAERIETLGIEWFVDHWLSLPIFSGLPESARFDSARLSNDPHSLAESLRRFGTGVMDPLWSRLCEINCPTLVLAGEHDDKFGEIGRRIAGCIGDNARFRSIPGAGHSVHLEQPGATAEVIAEFLDA